MNIYILMNMNLHVFPYCTNRFLLEDWISDLCKYVTM